MLYVCKRVGTYSGSTPYRRWPPTSCRLCILSYVDLLHELLQRLYIPVLLKGRECNLLGVRTDILSVICPSEPIFFTFVSHPPDRPYETAISLEQQDRIPLGGVEEKERRKEKKRQVVRRLTSSGANKPMSNHPIRLTKAWPPNMCTSLCRHPLPTTTGWSSPRFGFHHAAQGRSSSGQTPGRLRWTIFHVHSARVTKHVDRIPKVPRRVGCGSQTRLVVMSDEMLPVAPARRSHMSLSSGAGAGPGRLESWRRRRRLPSCEPAP